jgi:hypothetical protein
MKCTRVLRRVTSGAFKYCSANSRARLAALNSLEMCAALAY